MIITNASLRAMFKGFQILFKNGMGMAEPWGDKIARTVPSTGEEETYSWLTAIPGLRRGYLDKWQLLIDTMNGRLDDWWQGEAVEYTRNVAWRNAQKLWGMRHDMSATDKERAHLDRVAADLGKLLLSPLGEFLQ